MAQVDEALLALGHRDRWEVGQVGLEGAQITESHAQGLAVDCKGDLH